MKQSIGIYSGTFDPIHIGHISFAKEAMHKLKLDTVIFLPEQQPRDKQHVTEIHHRLELIRRAIQDDKNLHVLNLSAKQFTIAKTLPQLQKHFTNADLTFLIGSDIIRTFAYRWDGLEILLKTVSFAVGIRAGDEQGELETVFTELETQYHMPITRSYIITENSHLASSQFRKDNTNAQQLPHPSMLDYINENQLYTDT